MEAPTRAGLPGRPFACHVTAFPQNETHHSSTSIFTAGANPPFLNSPTACVLPAFTSPSGNHPPVPPPRTYSSNSAKALPVDSANIARVASSSVLREFRTARWPIARFSCPSSGRAKSRYEMSILTRCTFEKGSSATSSRMSKNEVWFAITRHGRPDLPILSPTTPNPLSSTRIQTLSQRAIRQQAAKTSIVVRFSSVAPQQPHVRSRSPTKATRSGGSRHGIQTRANPKVPRKPHSLVLRCRVPPVCGCSGSGSPGGASSFSSRCAGLKTVSIGKHASGRCGC
mmetsp:Transcript_20410/g.67578  ORF Transcript_20410/g.67578 Transcript_20410/m.67578 type:complete len:284 (+) Transcript_20410:172-1023(+)